MKKIVYLVVILLIAQSSFLLAEDGAADPRRPAAVETQEVPVVPPEVYQRLQQYQDIRYAGFAGWDPAGNGILIRTRFGTTTQLHQVREPGSARQQITFFDEPVSGYPIPKSKDGSLIVSLSRGGNENYQIYLVDREKYTSTLLTDGKTRNRLQVFSEDGSRMIVASNKRNGRDTDLYVADTRTSNSMELVFQTDKEYWYGGDWSPDGKTLLLGRYVSINESYAAVFDLETKKRRDVPLFKDRKGAIDDMEFSADGKSVYLSTDANGEFRQLARFDIDSGKYHWMTADIPWDVADVEVHAETDRVVAIVNENGASGVYLWENGKRRQLKLPLGIVSSLSFSPDGNRLGFTLSRPDAPSDAYSLDLADEKLTRWTFSEMGGLNPKRFVVPERIEFASFDKRKIPAYYFRPKTLGKDKKIPVLISIHGGPESQYRPYFSSSTQYYVNELGVAVIAPNVRGSNGYGKTYLKLDNHELREDSVKDIGALLDWIAEQPELDASRVAVAGGSYGGYMVLASLEHYGDRIKAGIDVVGIANFTTFLKNTADYRRDLRRAEYGDERDEKMLAVFERINPTANAEKIRSALMVAHGKNDPRVPFSEAEQIAERVRKLGRSVWTVYAGNEGHGFGKKENWDYLRAVQVMFLEKHLK